MMISTFKGLEIIDDGWMMAMNGSISQCLTQESAEGCVSQVSF